MQHTIKIILVSVTTPFFIIIISLQKRKLVNVVGKKHLNPCIFYLLQMI